MTEIKSLTALRGIAAMAVVMQHFSVTAQSLTGTPIPSLVPHGYVAVDFFFILSGFIMCYSYRSSFESQGWGAFSSFLGKRVARLMPLNAFVVLLLLLLSEISKAVSGVNIFFAFDYRAVDVVANLLMLQGLGIGKNMNGPSWSVSLEFFAYFFFPVFIYFVFHRARVTLLTTVCFSLAMLGYLSSLHPHLALNFEDAMHGGMRCVSEFLLGMATYRLYRAENPVSRLLSNDAVLLLSFAACAGSLLLKFDLPGALLFLVIVPGVALNRGLVNQFLSQPIFYFLGVISYSAYLDHNLFRPIAFELMHFFQPAGLDGKTALIFAFFASLSIIPVAWVTYRYIEYPSRQILRRTLAKRVSSENSV